MLKILGGLHRGRPFKSVPGKDTRPTTSLVRKAFFDIAGPIEGLRLLDLFAGSGAVALEALSRGAERAVAVEQADGACRVIAANARTLAYSEGFFLVQGDAMRSVEGHLVREHAPFDLVFADPPYGYAGWTALLGRVAGLVRPGGFIAVEHALGEIITLPESLASRREYTYGDTVIAILHLAGIDWLCR